MIDRKRLKRGFYKLYYVHTMYNYSHQLGSFNSLLKIIGR